MIASGGLESPVDGLKAHLLGADYYSAAIVFLRAALESEERLNTLLTNWRRGLAIALFSMGVRDWASARDAKIIAE